jgi:multidrug resistance efflux pump
MKIERKIVVAMMLITLMIGSHACDVIGGGNSNQLRASGVVEVVEVGVSPELSGQVADVLVEEGDRVSEGQALFDLDDQELQLQRERIAAQGEASIAAAELALLQAQQSLDDLQENWPLRAAEYQLELAQARDELEKAENRRIWQQKNNRATEDTIEYYEAQLTLADKKVNSARSVYNSQKDKSENNPERASARVALEQAEDARDEIVRILNWYKGEPTDIDQALLDANVAIARARVDEARQEYEKWQDGPDPDAVALAQANIKQAEASLELASSQTESQLRSIDLKLEDASVRAPMDGVVLTLSVDQGELVSQGMVVLTLGKLDRMTITVYVPENKYGLISVGDSARVEVDSFPDDIFSAEVVRIADQAEYTPRNVQTEEERQTTVYEIELLVVSGGGKLKPGMPADVIFDLPVSET